MKLKLETLIEKYKEGEVYYTNLVETHLRNVTNGMCSSNFITIQTLGFLLKVLEIKIKYQDLSDNTLELLRKLLEIIGGALNDEDLEDNRYIYYLYDDTILNTNSILVSTIEDPDVFIFIDSLILEDNIILN